MTPQERQQIAELFDRLASLEGKPRDAEAERAIADGVARAPHALYPLVQTVLVQDEALRAADARIRELEGEGPQPQGGFLDTMRDSLFGRRDEPRRGSVPSVGGQDAASAAPGFRNAPGYRPMEQQPPQYQQPPYQPAPGQQPQPGFGGGSFLGTAAASAAGVIGGALLLNSFRGMMGGGDHQRHSAIDQPSGGAPWGGSDALNSDLARQAGVDDIGRGGRLASADDQDQSQRAGLFDTAQNDDPDFGDDGGGFDGGGDGDTA
jgi:hypothetical protein